MTPCIQEVAKKIEEIQNIDTAYYGFSLNRIPLYKDRIVESYILSLYGRIRLAKALILA